MKTIEEWRKIFGLEYDDDDDGKSILQAIREEAFDAAIEAIEKALKTSNTFKHELYGIGYTYARLKAIKAIEELKEK